jgi:PhoPQ-activated pathogenicity-related protein
VSADVHGIAFPGYKERLGLIPKLMVSAAGDEFFMLTDSHAWWDQMPGPKYIE